jgi:proteic killer suppression protein
MYIKFKTKKLKKLCESHKELCKNWNLEVGKKIVMRLDAIRAASNLAVLRTLPQLHFHKLRGDKEGAYAITVHGKVRMVLEPIEELIIDEKAGGLDLSKVIGVMITYVGDYHDG